MEFFGLFMLLILAAVVVRLVAGGMDSDRVGRYIRSEGGELLEKHWAPFGKGWFGEQKDRIYEVRYRDRDGNIHEATVKTSLFSGVYFTEDRIVSSGTVSDEPKRDLVTENQRLRERIAELERRG